VISADGAKVVFVSASDALSGTGTLFLAAADGSTLTELTPGSPTMFHPDVDADGDHIVAGGAGVVAVAPDGSGTTLLADGIEPATDDTGSRVAYARDANVYLKFLASGVEQWIGPGRDVDLSANGRWVAYVSSANPFGTNADGNAEIFVYDAMTRTSAQLTDTTGRDNDSPSISGDGTWVYYGVSIPSGQVDLERVHARLLTVERVGGLVSCQFDGQAQRRIATNHDGSLAVFHGRSGCAGGNADGNREVYLIDRDTPITLRVTQAQPSVLEWDAGSGPLAYDVVRGDLAALAFADSEVDLGAVVCLHPAWPGVSTREAADDAVPGSGLGFFYLLRSLPGGDLGAASGGQARVAAAGDCP